MVVNMHSGAADDDDLEVLDGTAHRYLARALDEMMDSERGFFIDNQHPDDAEGILGRRSIAKPGEIAGKPEGLSLVDAIDQSFISSSALARYRCAVPSRTSRS